MTERDHLDRRLAEGLEQHMTTQIRHDTQPDQTGQRPSPAAPRARTIWVTALVGLVVVLLTVVALTTVHNRSTTLPATSPTPAAPTLTASPTPSTATLGTAALLRRLPVPEYGRLLHTWTEKHISSTGPFDAKGGVVTIAGVCNGGGAVSWTDVTGTPHTLSCNGLRIQQPGSRFNLGGDEQPTTTDTFQITVRVLKGSPTFIIRAWTVDPRIVRSGWYIANTSPDVPSTLRTCAAGDLSHTGTLDTLANGRGSVITVTSRSSTDCAIRSWPSLRYVGTRFLSDQAGMSLDSSEGELNKYHEFPPARITAGGHGYFIIGLPSKARLDRDEQQQAANLATATPQPSPFPTPPQCKPIQVTALQATVADTIITVPVPDKPASATCSNPNVSYGGVNPVVANKPTGE